MRAQPPTSISSFLLSLMLLLAAGCGGGGDGGKPPEGTSPTPAPHPSATPAPTPPAPTPTPDASPSPSPPQGQLVVRRDGCYDVTYEVDLYEVSFCVPEVVEGTPLQPGMVLTNAAASQLRIHRWVHDGREFRGETRFGHACQGVTPGEAPPADENWQLAVRVEVRQVSPRFQVDVTWQGTTRSCALGQGEFTIDAPVQGDSGEPPEGGLRLQRQKDPCLSRRLWSQVQLLRGSSAMVVSTASARSLREVSSSCSMTAPSGRSMSLIEYARGCGCQSSGSLSSATLTFGVIV